MTPEELEELHVRPPYDNRRNEYLVCHGKGLFLWRFRDQSRVGWVITNSTGRMVESGHHYYNTLKAAMTAFNKLLAAER